METTKYIGIWMDHSSARLMDFSTDRLRISRISSAFTKHEKRRTEVKGEYAMHNDEQHLQRAYYKQLIDAVQKHGHILLFGPSTAKDELANLLLDDKRFKNVIIKVSDADYITEPQQVAFASDYFKQI